MALYGDLTYDSRVRREAASLAIAGHEVSLVCLGDTPAADLPAGVRVLVRTPAASGVLPGVANPYAGGRQGRLGRLGRVAAPFRWAIGYGRNLRAWGRLAIEAAGPVDAWHVHDLPALAAIAPHVRSSPVVYDSHEIFLEAGTARQLPGPFRTLLRGYERRLVRRVAALVTVNDSLARELTRRYRPPRVIVVHNCPSRWDPPTADHHLLREAAGIPPGANVILYHGNVGRDRGIEQLAAALLAPGLEATHLVILGPGDQDPYVDMATEPRWGRRLHVLPAVPPAALLDWVVSADVGGVLIQRTTLNHYLSSPNKLFECLAAGVPVVASDFPTMRRIVLGDPAGPLGAVADPTDPVALATAIRSILDLDPAAAATLRERCRMAAAERWNWEVEMSRLVALYDELLGTSGPMRAVQGG